MKILAVTLVGLLMLGCEIKKTLSAEDKNNQEILSLIKRYQEAVNQANPDI